MSKQTNQINAYARYPDWLITV